jgi:hypothetical protein
MAAEKRKVEEYAPRIFKTWNERAEKSGIHKSIQPSPVATFIFDRKTLSEDMIRRELQTVRDEFVTEAKKLEVERIALLETELKEKYENEYKKKDNDLSKAVRIINIQNAILSRLYDEDKQALIKILRAADISEEDLKILAARTEG